MSKALTILHIGKYFPPFFGGIENFMAELIEASVAQGHTVTAIVHHHEKGQKFSKESYKQASVYRVPIWGKAVYVPLAFGFSRYLENVLEKEEPDVLHLHMPNVACFSCLFNKRAKAIPWVIHWHSDVLGASPDWKVKLLYPFYRFFEQRLLDKADRVIATSPAYAKTSEPLRFVENKVVVVPLGLKKTLEQQIIEDDRHSAEFHILTIGRLTYYKGHVFLLEAMAALQEQGIKAKLDIVGTGELAETLRKRSERLGLTDQVKFKGAVSEEQLEGMLSKADALCLPSIERTEAFGVVLLEAMRQGIPCVVTDVEGSGMNWVVEHEKTGIVVNTKDSVALANALTELAVDKKKRDSMGQKGRERFLSSFTIDQVTKKVLAIYNRLVHLPG